MYYCSCGLMVHSHSLELWPTAQCGVVLFGTVSFTVGLVVIVTFIPTLYRKKGAFCRFSKLEYDDCAWRHFNGDASASTSEMRVDESAFKQHLTKVDLSCGLTGN